MELPSPIGLREGKGMWFSKMTGELRVQVGNSNKEKLVRGDRGSSPKERACF